MVIEVANGIAQSVFAFNHSLSFSSALPRWEILFFSSLAISAYVWPSGGYSKAESQPVTALLDTVD